MTAGDPTRADIECKAAKLGGPAWARQFCERIEQVALVKARATPRAALAEELLRLGAARWAVAPAGDKEILVKADTCHPFIDFSQETFSRDMTAPEHEDYVSEFLEHLKGVENYRGNYIGFIHLDGGGEMTVGFGHWLPDVGEAHRLRDYFVLKVGGAPASDKVLSDDFARVTHQGEVNKPWLAHSETEAEIRENRAIELALIDIDIKIKEVRRRKEFSAFDTYPHETKLAVPDMAYQLGAKGAEDHQEGKFGNAVNTRNWKRAAALSHRTQAQAERNDKTREWLLEAAKQEPCWVDFKKRVELKPVIQWGRGANPALPLDAGPILL